MNAMTTAEENLTVKAVIRGLKDINALNGRAYNFLYLASGFIAHYNLGGFIEYYEEEGSLERDILAFKDYNQWSNFHEGEENYEYYMSKKRIYNRICDYIQKGMLIAI